jgi:hypothetical protein
MNEKIMVRQGDVLMMSIDSIPADAKPIKPKGGRHVLALGEATGHHHSIATRTILVDEKETSAIELFETPSQQEMFLLVKEGAALLEHQEHGPIALPGGKYKVVRQREFVPTPAGMPTRWSRVAD